MSWALIAAILLLSAGIVATLVAAIQRGNGAAIVNAVASLGAVLGAAAVTGGLVPAPAWLAATGSALTLWVAAAGLLHCVGMLGPYETVWWWDHLTHVVSGALVAALAYAGLLVVGRGTTTGPLDWPTVAALTVLFTLLAGVFWELIELVARDLGERFGVEPVLVHYGWRDTALDLLFDVVGALLVVLLDVRAFVAVADRSGQATQTLLVGGGGLLVLGSVTMAAFLQLDGGR